MSTAAHTSAVDLEEQKKAERKEKLFMRINRASNYLNVVGLGWITPLLKIAAGDNPRYQLKELWQGLGIPLLAIVIFFYGWSVLAPTVKTSLGAIPGPAQVWEQAKVLWKDHTDERAKAAAFYERQDKRNAKWLEKGKPEKVRNRDYTGKPTYVDQIFTSLQTVFMGFMIGTLLAIPIGIGCGLSTGINAAFNPLIQIFKPVSPLAWLPIVTMVVSVTSIYSGLQGLFQALFLASIALVAFGIGYALFNTIKRLGSVFSTILAVLFAVKMVAWTVYLYDISFTKAFITSALTVMLCSIWPTIINTALGVSSIDKDLMNVSRVLQLDWKTKVFKLVLPSSLPLIFTGLRLSLGVGWMVLIAAEMLAQNPGLGKFVWDEFQNGSSSSLAKIMVAVLTIGIIGFILDRAMYALQTMFTHSATR